MDKVKNEGYDTVIPLVFTNPEKKFDIKNAKKTFCFTRRRTLGGIMQAEKKPMTKNSTLINVRNLII